MQLNVFVSTGTLASSPDPISSTFIDLDNRHSTEDDGIKPEWKMSVVPRSFQLLAASFYLFAYFNYFRQVAQRL